MPIPTHQPIKHVKRMWYVLALAGVLSMVLVLPPTDTIQHITLIVSIFVIAISLSLSVVLKSTQHVWLHAQLHKLHSREFILPLIFFVVLVASLLIGIKLRHMGLALALGPLVYGIAVVIALLLGSSATRQELKTAAGLIGLVLFGLLLSGLVLELGLSLSNHFNRYVGAYWTHFVPHPDLGWQFRPNLNLQGVNFGYTNTEVALATNSLGLRSAPEPEEIPEDHFVIAVQGDSQIAGFGMNDDQTAVYHLQQCFDERSEVPVDVVNFGTNGYDLNQYLTQSLLLSDVYDVDLLVLFIHNANDYGGSLLEYSYLAYRPYWVLKENDLELVHPSAPFMKQIYGYRFQPPYSAYTAAIAPMNGDRLVYDPNHLLAWSWTFLTLSEIINDSASSPVFTEEEIHTSEFYSPYDGYWVFQEPMPEPFIQYQQTFERIMQRWNNTAPMTQVFLLPGKLYALPDWYDGVLGRLERWGYDINTSPTAFNDWLSMIVSNLAIPVHDLYYDINNTGDPAAFYLPDNSHLSAQGQQFIAEVACDELLPRIEVVMRANFWTQPEPVQLTAPD